MQLMRADKVCQLLDISITTLAKWEKTGIIKAYRASRRIVFYDFESLKFLNEEERLSLISEIPAGRLASADEAAQLISSVTDCGTYLTGQIISMDGGWC